MAFEYETTCISVAEDCPTGSAEALTAEYFSEALTHRSTGALLANG